MARVFKRKDRLSAMSEINITSLLDLVFCLLIIFMITTPLMEQSIKVTLPKQARNPAADQNPKLKYVTVTFTSDGHYYYDNDKTPITLEDLRAKFKELAAQPDPPAVSIRGDGSAPWDAGVQVSSAMQETGLQQMSIATQVK